MIARLALVATVLLAPCAAAAAQPVFSLSDTASLAQTLTRASDPALLEWSCGRLVTSLMQETPDGSPPSHNAQRDASFAAVRMFVSTTAPASARIACARRFYAVRYPLRDPANGRTISSAYGDAADETVLALLADRSAAVRAGAAGALWNSTLPADAHALLRQAQSDLSATVVAACFENLASSMRANVLANNNGALYDAAIARAMHSSNAVIVGGALHAYVARRGTAADTTLRRYAIDARPVVRREAIDAYAAFASFDDDVARFMESRLADRDPAVRVAVYERLFQMGDHRALPAIQRIALTAPTRAQRQAARDAAVGIRTETKVSFR